MTNTQFNGKTAIIYARVSTGEQSTKVQIDEIQKFCNENGITVVKVFSENVSGAALRREQMEEILNSDAMADILIVREISRISREGNHLDAINKMRNLSEKYGILVHKDNRYIERGEIYDFATGMLLFIELYGAAKERENTKYRTSTARDKYRENSPINAATGTRYVPFGLMKVINPNPIKGVNTKKIWVPNPEQWDMVEKVFALKVQGYSIKKVAELTGLTMNIVQQTIKNPKVRYYIQKDVLDACDSATQKNNSNPNPTKHANIYKDIIFVRDTDSAMVHQVSHANGNQYRAKAGESGTIKAAIIDEVVKYTLIAMFEFFELKKLELAGENEKRMQELKEQAERYSEIIEGKTKEREQQRRNLVYAPDEETAKMMGERIKNTTNEIERIKMTIERLNAEIERLQSIDYQSMNVTINEATFPDMVKKYVRRVECWHERRNHHIIKVYIYPDFVPANFYDFKAWKLYNYKKYTISEYPNPEATQTILKGAFTWDCKVFGIPYLPS